MLLTSAFSTTKVQNGGASSLGCLPVPTSSKASTSAASSHSVRRDAKKDVCTAGILTPGAIHTSSAATRTSTSLTSSQTAALNLYLRSPRSVVPLQLADIVGLVDQQTGEKRVPSVRKGAIKTSPSAAAPLVQCCIIGACPFDRCEVVATVVKKTVIYRQKRTPQSTSCAPHSDKGKQREADSHLADGAEEEAAAPEEVQLIFYELDDESGASITCVVHPSKVYSRQLQEARRHHEARQLLQTQKEIKQPTFSSSSSILPNITPRAARVSRSSKRSRRANSEEYETTGASEASEGDETETERERTEERTPRVESRMKTEVVDLTADRPTSDPRLWIYRYKSPPRPLPAAQQRKYAQDGQHSRRGGAHSDGKSGSLAAFEVPIFAEGTVLRVIGRVVANPTRGNERQIEATTLESVYEPAYISGRRKVPHKGNQYAEWHHTVTCRKAKLKFQSRAWVREMIGLDGRTTAVQEMPLDHEHASQDITMADSTYAQPSFEESNASSLASTSSVSSTSLLNASHLPSLNQNASISITSAQAKPTKRAKLPSCSTLYKQRIPITREIFALYVHQYFRDLERGKHGKRGQILPPTQLTEITGSDANGQQGAQPHSTIIATMTQLKEDKNLKWLAEIYARNEAKKLSTSSSTSLDSRAGSKTPHIAVSASAAPSAKRKAEMSIIMPSSSPAHNRTCIAMADTTHRSISKSHTPGASPNGTPVKKVKLDPTVVQKLSNELFRSTILKLVKEGVIIVYPPDVCAGMQRDSSSEDAHCSCKEKSKKSAAAVPPLRTRDGRSLRETAAALPATSKCACISTARPTVPSEDAYGLLTPVAIMTVVEKIAARLLPCSSLDVDSIWQSLKRHDDLWRYVSRDTVKECIALL